MKRAPAFAHLHVHSEYSLLDGMASVKNLAKRAAELGQPALGLTDHGVMSGCVELQQSCAREGIKPVFGCEVYFVDDRHDRSSGKVERNHLTLLAETQDGYRNLMKISSAGFLEGFRDNKPGVDLEVLHRHNEGIIAFTGCLASRFVRRINDDDLNGAREHAKQLIEIFGPEDVYFEVQENGLDNQNRANPQIAKIAKEFGHPLVATADVHYLLREDFNTHQALLCARTNSTLADPAMTFATNEFWLKSNEAMAAACEHKWPGALESTVEIAERANAEVELGGHLLPTYETPNGESGSEHLRALVEEGLGRRYGDPVSAEARERAELELSVIEDSGWSDYFLIVWDLVKHAKDNGIAVGPGRGSAAGSIVSYALNITDVDPIEHGLLFERFINAERHSLQNIIVDFSVNGRERVINYITEKYGPEAVSRIVTFSRMFPHAAVRDATRVLGHGRSRGDYLSKLIPDPQQGRMPSFDFCLEPGQPLAEACAEDPTAKAIVDLARGLEGIARGSSVHAAAVVVGDRTLTDIVPLQLIEDRTAPGDDKTWHTTTQHPMRQVEALALLKLDFLGLRILDVIEDALDLIERSGHDRPDMSTIPLDDEQTYKMLAAGDSIGVFQFESEGMREALKLVQPTEFNDLIALVAFYRPGVLPHIQTYARGKRHPDEIRYSDPRIKEVAAETYGVVIYQEQNMQLAKTIAGFSGPRADDLRRALAKKDRKKMAGLLEEFVAGCRASGTEEDVIDELWQTNLESADYAFNKSHAAAYAMIGYRCAWLKANHNKQYLDAWRDSLPEHLKHLADQTPRRTGKPETS